MSLGIVDINIFLDFFAEKEFWSIITCKVNNFVVTLLSKYMVLLTCHKFLPTAFHVIPTVYSHRAVGCSLKPGGPMHSGI